MGYTLQITIPSPSPLLVSAAVAAAGSAILYWTLRRKRRDTRPSWENENDKDHIIRTVEDLRSVIPAGISGSSMANATKVLDHLDDQMVQFLKHVNLVFLATHSTDDGFLQVSPKGDPAGMLAHVHSPTELWIPDRPGNRLVFGMQNLVSNPSIGICALVAGTDTTLRLGGKAVLSKNPKLCQQLQVRGCNATLVIQIHVEYAFFHCAKSFIRGKIWDASSMQKVPVSFGPYVAPVVGKLIVDPIVNQQYDDLQKAVDGKQPEKQGI